MSHASRNTLPSGWRFIRAVSVVALLAGLRLPAASLPIEQVRLPPLRIDALPATAHTQGLEIVAGRFYVTARRDDARPQRALLLRTAPGRADWDVWDITPAGELGHEAMAVAKVWVYFLPEDLGVSNRVFRVARNALLRANGERPVKPQ